jgi:hypothetical protein
VNGILCPPSFTNVAFKAPLEAEVIISVHKHRVGIHLSKLGIMERENSLDYHHIHRVNALHLLGISAMEREVVDRSVYSVSVSERVQVVTKELRLKSGRMIVISGRSFLWGDIRLVVVVGVERNDLNSLRTADSEEIVRQRGLATGGSTSD